MCGHFRKAIRGIFFCFVLVVSFDAAFAAPFAYITNAGSNSVSVMDIATNTVATTLSVGSNPRGVAVSPAGTRAYVTNYANNDVSVIDTATNSVAATIPLVNAPAGIAINPLGTRVYVTNHISGDLTIIDAVTNTVMGSVVSGAIPYGVAVHPSGSIVYVTNSGEDTVSVIDTATSAVLKKIPVGVQPYGIAVDPTGTHVYVANHGSSAKSTVSVIDTSTNTVTSIEVAPTDAGSGPNAIAINPEGTRVYVTNDVGGYVAVIDPSARAWIDSITVGAQPIGVSLNHDGTRLYVAMSGENSVGVIDTATKSILTKVPVGTGPYAFGQFVSQGILWKADVSFSLKFTFPQQADTKGNIRFFSSTQPFEGRIELFAEDLIGKQITFVSDDGTTTGFFRTLTSVMTDTSGRSDQLLLIGTGDFSSSVTGSQTTGIAYIDAKGTLKKDSLGAITSIILSGKIAGGVDQATVFSATFRATLTQ